MNPSDRSATVEVPVTQLHKSLVALLVLTGVALVLAFGIWPGAPHRPIARLDQAGMPAFQAKFDAARDSTRLLVLLSPT